MFDFDEWTLAYDMLSATYLLIFAFAITFDALFYLLRIYQLASTSAKDIGET
jgi:hypothetical protein